jgi:hypothetical protein
VTVESDDESRELHYSPTRWVQARYALAVAFLVLTSSKQVFIAGIAIVLGAVWWGVVGLQRGQRDWWLGFVVAALSIVVIGLAFALACYLRDRRAPPFIEGKVVTGTVRDGAVTYQFANGAWRIPFAEVSRIRRAFGFGVLIGPERLFFVAPIQVIPNELFHIAPIGR